MIQKHHTKIAIIGNAGSGKTTLSFLLHKKLNIPLYHLDQFYWLPNWERIGMEKFTRIHSGLCTEKKWIIEGPYLKTFSERALHADVIIFLDIPRFTCLWRVVKRAYLYHGTVRPGSPAACKEQVLNLKFVSFLKWVWNFNNRYRDEIITIMNDDQYKHTKQIYILKSPDEVASFLQDSLIDQPIDKE